MSISTGDTGDATETAKPTSTPPPTDPGVDYFRGGGGVSVDGKRVASLLVGLTVLTLAVLVVVLGIFAHEQNSRIDRLKQHGVPVEITVTSCFGIASGTGITESAFRCSGSFTLNGRTYNEVIGGSSAQLATGQKVAGVAVRDDPSILSSAASVRTSGSSWSAYTTAFILLIVLILIVPLWLWLRSRARAAR